jgi:hypothetical protein
MTESGPFSTDPASLISLRPESGMRLGAPGTRHVEVGRTCYELTDHEWAAIKSMLPNKPRGVARVNDRRVLKGALGGTCPGQPNEMGTKVSMHTLFRKHRGSWIGGRTGRKR